MLPYPRARLLAVAGTTLVTAAVYAANIWTPATVKLGLFYLVPVLVGTWFAGVGWGALFVGVAMVLRLQVELAQQETSTLFVSILNQGSFAVVAGITMFAFRHLQRTQRELHDLAVHDPLTRVLNARSFADRLTTELSRNRRYKRPLSLLYLDIDNFKALNDSRGHQTGDAALRLVADAMRRAVREVDVVGRMGGDEFAVLMPETDGALAQGAAARLAEGIRTAFDGTPALSASIGVVSFRDTAATTDEVLRRADQAMYEAKRAGKDRAVHATL
jgi:diguanylate cyclase (GGDEF)-like protein